MSHDDGIAEELQGELSYTEQRMLDRIRRRQPRVTQQPPGLPPGGTLPEEQDGNHAT